MFAIVIAVLFSVTNIPIHKPSKSINNSRLEHVTDSHAYCTVTASHDTILGVSAIVSHGGGGGGIILGWQALFFMQEKLRMCFSKISCLNVAKFSKLLYLR